MSLKKPFITCAIVGLAELNIHICAYVVDLLCLFFA